MNTLPLDAVESALHAHGSIQLLSQGDAMAEGGVVGSIGTIKFKE